MGKRIGKPHKLDNNFVRSVEAPANGAVIYWDSGGLGVRICAGGAKSFFLNYRIDGRQRRYTIGAFPRWSVTAAREEAKELRKRIDRGLDPAGQKRDRRQAPTVQDLIDRYIEDHLPKKAIPEPRIEDEKRMLGLIGDCLGRHTKVAEIHDGAM